MAGGVNGDAIPAGLGRALDRGVAGAAGGFGATEDAADGVGFVVCVHDCSKSLAPLEGRPSRTWSVRGDSLPLAVSGSKARGSSWVAQLITEGRGELAPGWFMGGGKMQELVVLNP